MAKLKDSKISKKLKRRKKPKKQIPENISLTNLMGRDPEELYISLTLLEKNFVPNLKKWWLNFCNNQKHGSESILISMYEFKTDDLKKFQETKNPYYLGRAISNNPFLLEHPIIRYQIRNWIYESSLIKWGDLKPRQHIQNFTKGLIPKGHKAKKKISELSTDRYVIKHYYDEIYARIKNQFKKDGARDVYEKAKSLRKIIPSKKKGSRFPKIPQKQFEQWASYKEPYDIAVAIIKTMLKKVNNYSISISYIKSKLLKN